MKYGIIAAGFAGIVGQVILLRSLETLFGGNELSVGIFFACWLIWSGIGAFFGRFLPARRTFYLLLIAQGILILLSLMLIRCWPLIVGRQIGTILGMVDMIRGGITLEAPLALATGILFTLGIKTSNVEPRKVYFWEAMGAGLGGIFMALVLGKISYFQIVWIILALNLFISFDRLWLKSSGILICLIGFLWGGQILNQWSLMQFWRGFDLIHETESVYGDIAIIRQYEQFSVFQNGLLSESFPNQMVAEETVHFPLLLHPAPKQIFLVGNGFSGAVEEILKYHSVEKVDYAEIDVKLLNSAQKTFPPQATEFMNDHRVRLIEEDGRKWIKRTKNEYDCIIIGLPDPSTGQLNRYFTREFFQEAKRALKSGGVFAFSLTASEDYIEPELAESLAGFARTLKQIFPQVVILPGEREQFLAGERLLCAESDSIIYRIKERGIENYYVSPYFLPFRLSVEKCQYLSKNLNVAKSRWLNRDFQPQGYIRTLARWERQFHPQWGKFYEELWSISGYQLLVAILVLTVLIAILFKGSMFEKGVMIGVGGAGMAQMGMQLMLILGFQSIFGYMFYQQAILIAGFMVGAALGSFEGRRWVVKVESKRRRGLLQLQGGMMLLPFFIFSLLWLAKDYGGVTKHLLSLGAIICGWMGGLQFALGASCLFGEGHKRGGGLYAVDLAGSALGALIAGVLLTPLLGFWWTAIILSAISLMPLILLIWGVNH